ncbi:hypothetical protein C2R22_08240 [Salinigranum rubrum]|uniref:Uncharacterized protein n=1 Tax=Salinigranum rubrum TaxID=755307 RepID=A0A2I8VID1_9EURY|nr:hypothetical protein C2R22_08240 [Salinigranum rubrum]
MNGHLERADWNHHGAVVPVESLDGLVGGRADVSTSTEAVRWSVFCLRRIRGGFRTADSP